jgi:hypothetical protein
LRLLIASHVIPQADDVSITPIDGIGKGQCLAGLDGSGGLHEVIGIHLDSSGRD